MHYFDTSFLAPLFIMEDKSHTVETIFQSITKDRFISPWLGVEFSSMIAKYLRMKHMNQAQASQVMNKFEELVEGAFYMITPTVIDFNLASSLLQHSPQLGLRAGDALHLAIAQNHGAKKFYTLDKVLREAAKKLTQIKIITS